VRFDRALVEAVKAYDVQFIETVEERLTLWLARRRRNTKAESEAAPARKRRTA
jgi:hypothetical protein